MKDSISSSLTSVKATQLTAGRALLHRASQHLTALARANLEAQPDDSHSNLGWDADLGGLSTQPIGSKTAVLGFAPLTISIIDGSEPVEELTLEGKSVVEVAAWLDQAVVSHGLVAASQAIIPYDLPDDVAVVERYNTGAVADQLAALKEWFELAHETLEKLVERSIQHEPGPSPVRCWPHHFDIATYIAFEEGDPEVARGMGVGMSPGDEGHDEPYFYINPWPHLDPNGLPPAPHPGTWHVDGYVGLVATGSALQEIEFVPGGVADFVHSGFQTAYDAQWPA